MSQFERENNECIRMVQDNRRRREVMTTVGYIVTEEEARELVASRAGSSQARSSGWDALITFLVCLFIAATGVLVLR